MTQAKETGARIARLRKERGLTQAQLAGRVGVTNKAVSKWETGAGLPDVAVLPALAKALGTSADMLLCGARQPGGAESALWALPEACDTRARLCAFHTARRWTPAGRAACTLGVLLALGLYVFSLAQLLGGTAQPWSAALAFAGAFLLADELMAGMGAALLGAALAKRRPRPMLYIWPDTLVLESGGERVCCPCEGLRRVRLFRRCIVLEPEQGRPFAVARADVPDEKALLAHLAGRAPALRVEHARPKAGLAVFAAAAVLCTLGFAGAWALRAQGVCVSISPAGHAVVMRADPRTGGAAWYRRAGRETFAYAFKPGTAPKFQWLTGDACAVTYTAQEDGLAHQSVVTFGDRGSGVSYYYVLSALTAQWKAADGTRLWVRGGTLFIEYGGVLYQYAAGDCVQFGTLAVVACSGGVPQFTVVLGEDFTFLNGDGGVGGGGSIVVCPVLMERTVPAVLAYEGEA